MDRAQDLVNHGPNADLIELLEQQPELVTTVDGDCRTVLQHAIAAKRTELVETLVERFEWSYSHQDEAGWTALHQAASLGMTSTVKLLLPHYPNVIISKGGQTPLHYAAGKGHIAVVRLLLSMATIRDARGQTALHRAATLGRTEVVELLLAHSPQLINWMDADKATALDLAEQDGHETTAAYLLECGGQLGGGEQ
ncbi:ankyrin repeat protein [Paramicrosporidium saccamoebae]|uniref:Ankyrin repeat protein n=1 Tax=Paramicrosporidium saccamoebae TaxID=1246581 RepID=A0A2H9TJ19_9FUNG|nr:ankyrin repeat protein [Paramicrosporidium saccamoebae]